MTVDADPNADPDAEHEVSYEVARRIARLERRLERERAAREEAEGIADRRMRELWLANRELDARVAERTRELEQAMANEERMNRAAAGFFTNLSHEMFTPLNGIVGTLELLKETSHSDKDRAYIDAGLHSTDRLHQLLQRVHDLTELRIGRMTVAPITLLGEEIASGIAARWRTPCLKAQKLLAVSSNQIDAVQLRVDVQRLNQIVDELVGNAVLHADPGVVAVDMTISAPPSDSASGTHNLDVAVSDSGPGFDYVAAANLLDAVSRIDYSPGRATEGAGIGLPLVAALLDVLGGTFELESAPGSPTTARATVPVTFVEA